MNRLSPYRPGYIDLGPLPPPEEFNSLEELLNTKWLTEHMRIDKDNESIKIKNIQIESGTPGVTYYWVMLSNPLTDQFITIGKLDTLEHIPEDMIVNEEQFAVYVERMKTRIAENKKRRLEEKDKENKMDNGLSGSIDGIIRIYKFTKTNFYGIEESNVYIPILSIEVKESDGLVTYRHFSINRNRDVWEDVSRRLKSLAEYPPRKEWIYYLHNFTKEMDARLELTNKFIEFKNNYDDTSFSLVDSVKVKFKENK